ncbi:MAG: type II secretion system protein GspL [Wenzhouxiangella sp.]
MPSAGKEKLLVHATGPTWAWQLVDRTGAVGRQGRCAPDRPDWPADRKLTVLVDASACIGLKLDLPEMPAGRLQQALRWAAEEHLASSAEDEHVAAGPRDSAGLLCCVVINRDTMAGLQDRFGDAPVEVMLPDALCLPWQSGQVSLAAVNNVVLARWGDWDFGSFEPDLLIDMLAPVVDENAEWVWHGGPVPSALADHHMRTSPGDGLTALAAGAIDPPVNLLSGPFEPSSARAAQSLWRWAAGLAGLAVALVLAAVAVENHQLKRQSDALQAAIDAQFYQAFPDVGRVVRHREQAEREMARLRFGRSAGLLDLMNRAAPIIDAQGGIELDGLNYRDGQLELTLRAPDVAALDQFEQRLRAQELNAVVQSASMGSDGASGRLRISEGRR